MSRHPLINLNLFHEMAAIEPMAYRTHKRS
jgi:hypothetical protein